MHARGMPYNRMIPKSGYRFSDKIGPPPEKWSDLNYVF
jgi:hypothetical protein